MDALRTRYFVCRTVLYVGRSTVVVSQVPQNIVRTVYLMPRPSVVQCVLVTIHGGPIGDGLLF